MLQEEIQVLKAGGEGTVDEKMKRLVKVREIFPIFLQKGFIFVAFFCA